MQNLSSEDVVGGESMAPYEFPDNQHESFTDAGNAEQLARLNAGLIRYVPRWNKWLAWHGGRWIEDPGCVMVTEKAKAVGRYYLRQAADTRDDMDRTRLQKAAMSALSAGRIRGMIDLSRGLPGIITDHTQLDARPWLLNVRNGTLDLKTGRLLPARPDDLLTKQTPVEYDARARAPRWERALCDWFPDPEMRSYVQRLVGAALVGQQLDHVFVIHYGAGANGKGTFTRALMATLGADYIVTPHMSLLVQLKHGSHDTEKAALCGARLAIASETERRVKLAEASIKNLTGNDTITCRRLYEDPWSFEPSHTLWLQTNHLPEIGGRDQGIWRRVKVVPWDKTFKRDGASNLDHELAQEGAGILAWAVQGCLAWQRDGLSEPETVVRATLSYRKAEDALERFRKDAGLTFEKGLSISAAVLTARFDEWTASEGVRVSPRDLKEWLEENGAEKRKQQLGGTREYRWFGVSAVQ